MKGAFEEATVGQKRIKIVLLGSGYNQVQEGNTDYTCLRVAHIDIMKLRLSKGSVQTSENNLVLKQFSKGSIFFGIHKNKIHYAVMSHTGTFSTGVLDEPEVCESLKLSEKNQEIIKSKHALNNPFIDTARKNGYWIEVESVDHKSAEHYRTWMPEPNGNTSWGHVTRTQANLAPTTNEDNAVLDALVEKWRKDIETYDGVAILNTDGDGFLDATYWPIYFEFERSSKVYFADWCTCCTSPTETSRAFLSLPGRYSSAKEAKAMIGLSPAARVFRSYLAMDIENDFQAWLKNLDMPRHGAHVMPSYKRFGLFCEPAAVEKIQRPGQCDVRCEQFFNRLRNIPESDKQHEMTNFLIWIHKLMNHKKDLIGAFVNYVSKRCQHGLPAAIQFAYYIQHCAYPFISNNFSLSETEKSKTYLYQLTQEYQEFFRALSELSEPDAEKIFEDILSDLKNDTDELHRKIGLSVLAEQIIKAEDENTPQASILAKQFYEAIETEDFGNKELYIERYDEKKGGSALSAF